MHSRRVNSDRFNGQELTPQVFIVATILSTHVAKEHGSFGYNGKVGKMLKSLYKEETGFPDFENKGFVSMFNNDLDKRGGLSDEKPMFIVRAVEAGMPRPGLYFANFFFDFDTFLREFKKLPDSVKDALKRTYNVRGKTDFHRFFVRGDIEIPRYDRHHSVQTVFKHFVSMAIAESKRDTEAAVTSPTASKREKAIHDNQEWTFRSGKKKTNDVRYDTDDDTDFGRNYRPSQFSSTEPYISDINRPKLSSGPDAIFTMFTTKEKKKKRDGQRHHTPSHQPESPQTSEWACDSCTFVNTHHTVVCFVCTTPQTIDGGDDKSSSSIASARYHSDPERFKTTSTDWTCKACTLSNGNSLDACALCSKPRSRFDPSDDNVGRVGDAMSSSSLGFCSDLFVGDFDESCPYTNGRKRSGSDDSDCVEVLAVERHPSDRVAATAPMKTKYVQGPKEASCRHTRKRGSSHRAICASAMHPRIWRT